MAPAEANEHEAALTGVMALANLYSNCIEAFGLIHPGQKWEKEEQMQLCRVGVQQARLLTWGDVVGISSPPASVTNSAIPRHPSAAYPDLKEPTFFGARDPRLDETETRTKIESALSDIVDRSAHTSRDEMMAKYGLKPPKRFANDYHATLDTNRLEGFRERYELLKEVAETYAQISSRRNSSLTQTSWQIADHGKFNSFIKLMQEKVDLLIHLMDAKEKVDRAMRMDIKALGWHLSVDRQRIALDISKLRMIAECCKEAYPEYIDATDQALQNIERERRENITVYNPYTAITAAPQYGLPAAQLATARRGSTPGMLAATQVSPKPPLNSGHANGGGGGGGVSHEKRPSIFGKLFGRKSNTNVNAGRSQSVSAAPPSRMHDSEDTPRSLSNPGPDLTNSDAAPPALPEPERPQTAPDMPTEKLRSKSVGDILVAPTDDEHVEIMAQKLERLNTLEPTEENVEGMETVNSAISRHDQYHGLARQGTKTQWD